jgi:hypothetical protein
MKDMFVRVFPPLGIPTCKGPLFVYYSNETIISLLNLELIYRILAFTRGIFKLLYLTGLVFVGVKWRR